jgi:hypothetical protein
MTVLVTSDSAWAEAAVKWSNAGALSALSGKSIASTNDNFVNWGGVAAVAGHVTVPVGTAAATRMLDITDAVKAAGPGATISLLVYRPYRNNGYPTAGGGAYPIAADDLRAAAWCRSPPGRAPAPRTTGLRSRFSAARKDRLQAGARCSGAPEGCVAHTAAGRSHCKERLRARPQWRVAPLLLRSCFQRAGDSASISINICLA